MHPVVQQGLRRLGLLTGGLWSRPPGPPQEGWTAKRLGHWGEEWAAHHYFQKRGAAILACNWRGGGGELDLVVREGEELVFVEVKTRSAKDPEPLAQVRDAKRKRHFRSAANAYTARLGRPKPPIRFDVLLVTPNEEKPNEPQIDCLVNVMTVEDNRADD